MRALDSLTNGPQAQTSASVVRRWHSQPHASAPVQHARPMNGHLCAAAADGTEAPAAGTGRQGPHRAGGQRTGGEKPIFRMICYRSKDGSKRWEDL